MESTKLQKIKPFFSIDKNILYVITKLFITTVFALAIFLDSTLVFVQNIRGSVDEIYFLNAKSDNILLFIKTWVITFVVLSIIGFIVDKIEPKIYRKIYNKKKKRVFFIIFFVLILAWMPYILSYFPGGIFSDTQQSIKQALRLQSYDNLNPLAYALLLKICLKIGMVLFSSYQAGINIFAICQITVMALIISYFIYWLYRKNFSYLALIGVTAFFGIFKLIPMYALSLWKDTPFSLALFLYIIFIAEIVNNNGRNLNDIKMLIINSFLLLSVSFLRNNGPYIALATTIMVSLVYRKSKIFKYIIASLITFVVIFIIRGPVFTYLGINEPIANYNAVMLSQIFYVKVTDGNITEEQDQLINTMCEEDSLREAYSPILFDPVSIAPGFNRLFIDANKTEISKLWIELFVQNPKLYAQSFLLSTLGFWDVNKVFVDAYISHFMWPGTEDIIDVHQTDYIQEITGHSIIENIKINKLYSSAIFFYITTFSAVFTIKKKRYRNLLIYLPSLFTWGTIMLATPIAFSLRYVYILVLMIPFNFIIPFLQNLEIPDEKKL